MKTLFLTNLTSKKCPYNCYISSFTDNSYKCMSFEELEKAKDDFDEEDQRLIELFRQRCITEWKSNPKGKPFGELCEIFGDQYVREVTQAGEDVWVVLHLYRPGDNLTPFVFRILLCRLLNQHFNHLAQKFPKTKFLKIIAESCIPNYPDRHLPTVFVYKKGQIHAHLIGGAQCGGQNVLEEGRVILLKACSFKHDQILDKSILSQTDSQL
ncbi:PDCL3 protein, partial [Amia calva]|nr:PDCL3 protein [Amia calva]